MNAPVRIASSARRSALQDRYASPDASAELLARGQQARLARLDADDIVNSEVAAKLANATKPTVIAWIASGRCIGLQRTTRGWRLPSWQFEPRIFEALPEISRALDTTDGWALLDFLETPHGALDGLTPRQALERGFKKDRVVALAGSH
jgi:hypothetical protein